MTEDARFEDGAERPINLGAEDAEDLKVVSTLCQDAVFPMTEMQWIASERRFALLLNRFRWEDTGAGRHAPERVQALLHFEDVTGVSSQGIDRTDKDVVLSLLSVEFKPTEDGAGHIELTLAGDGGIRLAVESINVVLKDVTRPYVAPTGSVPKHDD